MVRTSGLGAAEEAWPGAWCFELEPSLKFGVWILEFQPCSPGSILLSTLRRGLLRLPSTKYALSPSSGVQRGESRGQELARKESWPGRLLFLRQPIPSLNCRNHFERILLSAGRTSIGRPQRIYIRNGQAEGSAWFSRPHRRCASSAFCSGPNC